MHKINTYMSKNKIVELQGFAIPLKRLNINI